MKISSKNRELAIQMLSMLACSDGSGPIGDVSDYVLDINGGYPDYQDCRNHPAKKLEQAAFETANARYWGYDSVEAMNKGEEPVYPILWHKDGQWRERYAEAEAMLRCGWKPSKGWRKRKL